MYDVNQHQHTDNTTIALFKDTFTPKLSWDNTHSEALAMKETTSVEVDFGGDLSEIGYMHHIPLQVILEGIISHGRDGACIVQPPLLNKVFKFSH